MKKKLTKSIVFCSFLFISVKIFAGGCVADFGYTIDGTNVSFTEESSGFITSYFWDFGDGTYAYEPNPEHDYIYSGIYTACLYISNSDSTCFDYHCEEIVITDGLDCSASFTVSIGGLTAYFYDASSASSGTIDTYAWDFGDGDVSTDDSPTHTYSSDGIYDVCLTISTTEGCTSTYCQTVYLIDSGFSECTAYFNYSVTDYTAYFNNLSDDGGASSVGYFWDFGDGSATSTLESPSHSYASGTYEACLTIFTSDSCSSSYCSLVVIGEEDSSDCIADFTFTTGISPDGTFLFDNLSSSGSYQWNFGDGSAMSTEINPEHTYEIPGEYIVCLAVYCADSSVSEYCDTVSFTTSIDENYPIYNFALFPNPANAQIEIQFYNNINQQVSIYISDITGKNVADVFSGNLTPGNKNVITDVQQLHNGIYFITIQANELFTMNKKLSIIR